jgi:hypothetical protein
MLYGAWVALLEVSSPVKWLVFAVGLLVAFIAWVNAAMGSEREATKDNQIDHLERVSDWLLWFMVTSVPTKEWHLENHQELKGELQQLRFMTLGQPRTATVDQPIPIGITAAGTVGPSADGGAVPPGAGGVTVTPGPGGLTLGAQAPALIAWGTDPAVVNFRRRLVRNLGYALQYDDGTLEFHNDELPNQPPPQKAQDPNSAGPPPA